MRYKITLCFDERKQSAPVKNKPAYILKSTSKIRLHISVYLVYGQASAHIAYRAGRVSACSLLDGHFREKWTDVE
jgi:hypothetical protein